MDMLQEKAFQLGLYWNSRPTIAKRLVQELGARRSDNLRFIEFDHIRVAAIQVEVRPTSSLESFLKQLYPLTRNAVEQGAQLIVFPEHVTLGLFGMLPGFEQLGTTGLKETLETLGQGVTLDDLLRFVGPPMIRVYRAAFAELSRVFGVYIVAGSTLLLTRAGVSNVSHIFGPNGKLLGTNASTHLRPIEAELGVIEGDGLCVHTTRIGKLAAPVCMTGSFFEGIRLLVLKGAEIIALPAANCDASYNFWRALRGLWPRVQESPAYGIKACLVGDFMGMHFVGKSAVYAPLELTAERDGILAQLESYSEQGVVVADLDLVALREHRQQVGFYQNLNVDLYRRYLPWLYTGEKPPLEAWNYEEAWTE